MKKNLSFKNGSVIVVGILFVLWLLLSLVIPDLSKTSSFFWVGFAFVDLAFVLVGLIFFFARVSKNRIFSVMWLSYALTIIYFAITFIMNVIFMSFGETDNLKACLIPNVIVLLLFIAAMVIAYAAIGHIDRNDGETKEKVRNLKVMGVSVSSLISLTQNENVAEELGILKSEIVFSDPIGNSYTSDAEARIENGIERVRTRISENADESAVIAEIKSVRALLKERNELLKASK